MHNAAIPAADMHIVRVYDVGLQPFSQPISIQPGIFVHLEDVLGLDMIQSPFQSGEHLLAQMRVVIHHVQVHDVAKHVILAVTQRRRRWRDIGAGNNVDHVL